VPAGPFLSHKRGDAGDVDVLWAELALRGASAWQDVRDLRLGQSWGKAFRRAILWRTDGFIWWATKASLESKTITRLEVPWALRRTSRLWRRPYPVVPLFVDLDPGRDGELLERAFTRKRAEALLGSHGAITTSRSRSSRAAQRAATSMTSSAAATPSRSCESRSAAIASRPAATISRSTGAHSSSTAISAARIRWS
jgi:hypothetical protein